MKVVCHTPRRRLDLQISLAVLSTTTQWVVCVVPLTGTQSKQSLFRRVVVGARVAIAAGRLHHSRR
jgi:hypothetical protein